MSDDTIGRLVEDEFPENATYLSDEAMQEFARQWNEHHAHGKDYIVLKGNATPAQLQNALERLLHPEDLEFRPLPKQPKFTTSPASLSGEQIELCTGIETLEVKPIPSTPVPPGAAYTAWEEVGLVPGSGPASLEYKPDLDAVTALARGMQAGPSYLSPSSALIRVPGLDVHLKIGGTASANFDLALKASQLAAIEREVLDLQSNIERAQWGVVALLTRIQAQDLFLAAWNEHEDRYYRSFSEYLPDVLARWYQRGLISTDSVRQIRTYLRAQRIFLNPANGFDLTREDITDLGITHFERLAEALDYDKETGLVAERPRAGKLGVAEASEVLDEIREGTYTVQDTRAALDELRGVTRKNYSIDVRQVTGDHFELRRLMSWEDGVGMDLLGGMSRADLDRLCKALGIKEPHIEDLAGTARGPASQRG